ncbi:MarR family winged helix-turn-helix transcriptional regulator [Nonomuraea diastatica]|uniref:MarR family transcriptional regulator n=1 Tax=Nonomuraea diastatica TaxID=1848329 RepID=A0A4R4W3F9_9ACTN|nr:MarR family transcriptional regulator [Nonomuraea diastatica]TDD13078.1 MarR family transcriptional regulator [Nonomuraea diastatica]
MHDSNTTANLLGATALALTDVTLGNVTRAAGVTARGATALVTLSASPGLSVSELGRRVGLTQSAAARMVDTLEADGLLTRSPHPFNRHWVTVSLTETGWATTQHILGARATPLGGVLECLDQGEQQTLSNLLVKILTRLYENNGNAQYICRLCDRGACATEHSTCPVGEAERQDRRQPN